MSVTLTVVRGPHTGRTFTFDGHETFLVGRSSSTHFPLSDDPYLSRVHFLVEVNPPLCRVADLNSHNGIRVNKQPVRNAELRDGDEIEAGRSAFKLLIGPSDPADGSGVVVPVPEGRDEDDDEPDELGRLLDEIEDRWERGETPNLGEYVSRFPRYAAALRVAFLAHAPTHSPEPPPPPPPAAPRRLPTLPGYTLLGELGRGGMGMVYHARREADGSEVAVKTITAGAAAGAVAVGRFLREAKVLQQLRHPNVVAGLDAGAVKGVPFIVMEYVPGTNTGRLLKERGPLAVGLAVRLTVQLCEALGYAHGQGIVHRDVKPSNMLLRPETPPPAGGSETWATAARTADAFVMKLADFGLARAFQDSSFGGLTVTGTGAGTPPFMPPEQVRDFRTARPHSDQYAAGATLYYLLCGRFPHEGETTGEILRHILEEPPTPLTDYRKDVPAAVTDAVHRALAPKPADRYADVAAFAAALQAAAE